jgi:hypothetical protein
MLLVVALILSQLFPGQLRYIMKYDYNHIFSLYAFIYKIWMYTSLCSEVGREIIGTVWVPRAKNIFLRDSLGTRAIGLWALDYVLQ